MRSLLACLAILTGCSFPSPREEPLPANRVYLKYDRFEDRTTVGGEFWMLRPSARANGNARIRILCYSVRKGRLPSWSRGEEMVFGVASAEGEINGKNEIIFLADGQRIKASLSLANSLAMAFSMVGSTQSYTLVSMKRAEFLQIARSPSVEFRLADDQVFAMGESFQGFLRDFAERAFDVVIDPPPSESESGQ